jgi:hypothetical protein
MKKSLFSDLRFRPDPSKTFFSINITKEKAIEILKAEECGNDS